MTPRLASTLRYLVLLIVCGTLAAIPWLFSSTHDPMPVDFRFTSTALSATRTARLVPPETWAAATQEALANLPTATATPSPTPTETPTLTPTPVPSATSTNAPTPTKAVLGNTTAKINTYTCPAPEFKRSTLEEGAIFTILGWDETLIDGKPAGWLLIEDQVGQPQVWIRDSEFIIISVPDYKAIVPRAACRTTLR